MERFGHMFYISFFLNGFFIILRYFSLIPKPSSTKRKCLSCYVSPFYIDPPLEYASSGLKLIGECLFSLVPTENNNPRSATLWSENVSPDTFVLYMKVKEKEKDQILDNDAHMGNKAYSVHLGNTFTSFHTAFVIFSRSFHLHFDYRQKRNI